MGAQVAPGGSSWLGDLSLGVKEERGGSEVSPGPGVRAVGVGFGALCDNILVTPSVAPAPSLLVTP